MHSHTQNTAKSIRFRRWSRAGYAIFCSLACTVTIGCLAISISDKSLEKSARVSTSALCLVDFNDESSDKLKQAAELESALLQTQEATIMQIVVDNTVACGQYSNYNIFNQNG
jgi:hypothetical protein